MDTLAERVRFLREASGLSQVKFGEAVGLSDSFISMLESGKRPRIGQEAAILLARSTGAPAGWVSFGEGKKPSAKAIRASMGIKAPTAEAS